MNLVPFKNDIVGSFLRPQELKKAREKFKSGEITRADLKTIEDKLIIDLIKKQESNGLKAVTDGEFRRRWWHLDFIVNLNGLEKLSLGDATIFQDVHAKDVESYSVNGKISFPKDHPFLDDFKFVRDLCENSIAKQTIPGPNMVYYSGVLTSKKYLDNPYYENLKDLEDDLVKAYQDAIQAFYDVGCRYLQLDDTAWGALADPKSQELIRSLGYDPIELVQKFGDLTERALENKPEDMGITFHMCRGNFQSSWLYEGDYDLISKRLFEIENFDGFFLEYDSKRAGDFKPLKNLKNQKIVLGLITSKSPQLEKIEDLIERVKEAAEYVPLKQICVSPQCGFASTEEGNHLTEEDQWKKVRLCKELADKIEAL
ncbi:5-methyltetrahydropteroyltriglutamate--homocysteine methyltransferase [Anaerosphaera aminiphila DSM 21120]|uniref:5-methyltetrahydropteroyltriglutamate--homocysteine methyltransferase n=1 Tax=Anaerosphaera aminiphila DSM 21120 TaxID=1120995 RepID=A0A1M5UQH7_9FIRM|nr:5-methyltetrahydropteroyltriglutamate--homocysteine S-methyltransferase [Anaerosphaera aminiphila]SHH65088.1 5-methyltetrahydropteroyltriglutamate--homocysteine methyltransferase [Anaerosphaera aminiphila DSM 21120]